LSIYFVRELQKQESNTQVCKASRLSQGLATAGRGFASISEFLVNSFQEGMSFQVVFSCNATGQAAGPYFWRKTFLRMSGQNSWKM
jgi:hypothetical protein